MINADRQRHHDKIETYTTAVENLGFAQIEHVIGGTAMNAFQLAADASRRQQPDCIVATFLARAQETFDDPCGEYDIYDFLKSLHRHAA